jgi:hypothetical protein
MSHNIINLITVIEDASFKSVIIISVWIESPYNCDILN